MVFMYITSGNVLSGVHEGCVDAESAELFIMVANFLVADMHETYEDVILQVQVVVFKINVHGVSSFVLDDGFVAVFGNQLICRGTFNPRLKPEDFFEGGQVLNVYSVKFDLSVLIDLPLQYLLKIEDISQL